MANTKFRLFAAPLQKFSRGHVDALNPLSHGFALEGAGSAFGFPFTGDMSRRGFGHPKWWLSSWFPLSINQPEKAPFASTGAHRPVFGSLFKGTEREGGGREAPRLLAFAPEAFALLALALALAHVELR